jgi:hypothetical protein
MLVSIILRSPPLLFHCRRQSVGNHVRQIPSEGVSTVSCNALLLLNVIGGGQVTWGVKNHMFQEQAYTLMRDTMVF